MRQISLSLIVSALIVASCSRPPEPKLDDINKQREEVVPQQQQDVSLEETSSPVSATSTTEESTSVQPMSGAVIASGSTPDEPETVQKEQAADTSPNAVGVGVANEGSESRSSDSALVAQEQQAPEEDQAQGAIVAPDAQEAQESEDARAAQEAQNQEDELDPQEEQETVWVRDYRNSGEIDKTYNEMQISDDADDYPLFESANGQPYNESQFND